MSVFSVLAEVLFVGHSLVGPVMPPMVEAGLRHAGDEAAVSAQIINGAPLAYNWDHSATAEGVDARARLARGGVDTLILTEAIPLAAQIEFNDSAGRVAAFAGLAAEVNPQVRVYLYETWHSLASGTGAVEGDPGAAVPWRERLHDDLAVWQGVATQASAASGVPVGLIPAGQAMGLLADEIAAGRVPGMTDIRDAFSDDIHPNGKGWYLVTMVHLAVLTGRSPEGLPARLTHRWPSRDAVISPELAQALQRIAWQAVQTAAASGQASGATPAGEQPLAPHDPPPTIRDARPAAVMPDLGPVTNPRLSVGLAGVNDWSVQQPFLDIMKTARPWTGHLPGQWGGWDHDALQRAGALDENGWPLRIPPELTGIATLVLTDLPEDAGGVAGRYVLRWQGRGTLDVGGRAQVVARQEAAGADGGQVLFDFTPGPGGVILTLTATDPADPLRDITILREDRLPAHAAGEVFNPDWLARLRGVSGLRFMDWMATNNATLLRAADRPMPGHYTWARNGVPVEVMVALANRLQADPWFTLPHLAEDDLARTYAEVVQASLDPGLRAHVELSNEVWNWQFAQATWAEEQARARWGQKDAWVQFYALRAMQVAGIWAEVFAAQPDRLVRVIATQTGWLGLEDQILNAPLVLAEGLPAPATAFDAYAITGYVSGGLGHEDKVADLQGWLAESAAADPAAPFDLAAERALAEIRSGAASGRPVDTLDQLLNVTFPHHAAVAARHGLDLLMYEGGTHVVGIGPVVEDEALTDFYTHLNYSPQMGAIYADLLAGWARVSDAPFNAFVDVQAPTKWGSWGALRHLWDDNPRWHVLANGCPAC